MTPKPSPTGRVGRWHTRLAILLAGTAAAWCAFAPWGQAYLAWFALVPLMWVVRGTRSLRAAFAWGCLAGVLVFGTNLWWLWTATLSGTAALVLYFSLYWGAAAAAWRGLGLLGPDGFRMWGRPPAAPASGMPCRRGWESVAAVLLIPVVWVACEWLRAHVARGFPWLFLGHSQSPLPVVCQIADMAGVFGVSFCVVLVNAMAFQVLTCRSRRSVLPAGIAAGSIVLAVVGYGVFRLAQDATFAGPRVMVVQSNHPHLPGGTRTVSREDAVGFHLKTTEEALQGASPDLIVWSETVAPPLNAEAREELRRSPAGESLERTHRQIGELAVRARASLVTGANHVGGWVHQGTARVGTEIRNSVYLYGPDGVQSAHRYDKTQLVPFAETVAFRESIPWLHRVFLWLSPPVAAQPLVAGDPQADPVFTLLAGNLAASSPAEGAPVRVAERPSSWRFITPICLENIEPELIARMLRDPRGPHRRADFLVNVSNDGWFHPIERAQHLQNIIFRCIENRVPAARASNTGISGFIDSAGRVVASIPPGAEGTLTRRLMLDRRVTFYTRHGDVFAEICTLVAAVTVAAAAMAAIVWHRRLAGAAGRATRTGR